MTNYYRGFTYVPNIRLKKYFRLEVEPVSADSFDEYVRLEVTDSGDFEEVIGLEIREPKLTEVVGIEVEVLPGTMFFD